MKGLRKLIIATHRDVGYFFAGLTVIYAVSGIAVNHIDAWNPNYVLHSTTREVGELENGDATTIGDAVLQRLGITEAPKSTVRMAADSVKVFLEQRTLTVSVPAGRVIDETVGRRFALFEMNYLHLNHGKGFWTWFADAYAVGLLVLALTGIFIITGKKGMGGRGRWLLIAGLIVPAVFLLLRL